MKTSLKPRLALFGQGILGGGTLGHGIPVLTDLFDRLSNDFEIVYYCFTNINTVTVPAKIKVRQISTLPLPGRVKFLFLSTICIIDHIRNPFSLIFSVAIFPTGQWAIRVGKILRLRVVVQMIAYEAVALEDIGYGNLVKPALKRITENVCEKADVLLAVAEYQKDIALASLPTRREIIVLPLRINVQNFPYSDRNISYPIQFIQIAYYSPVKDQDTMFRSFAKVARHIDCHLTVIGEGFNTTKVQNMIVDLEIADRVTFTGVVMQSQLPYYFAKAHILLHTARFETGCAVIQEAMASGVVVCGTRVGILSDIGDQYAVIVSVGDDARLAEKILSLVNDTQLYDGIRIKAFEWIVKHDASWAYQNYRDFLKQMVAEEV